MPKQTYKIQQFHGGLNSDSDPRDLIEGQSPTLVDCGIDSVGRLKLMGATTEVDGSGNSFAHEPLTSKNRGLFVMSSDRQLDGDSGDETLIFSYDSNDNKVDARDSETGVNGGWNANVISPSGAIDPVYYAADGVVRVGDKAFNRNTRWFGYIADEKFNGLRGDSDPIGWYDTDQSIAAPTVGKCLISTPAVGSDANGVNSSVSEYYGTVADESATDNDVLDSAAVNLRVGINYDNLLPNLATNLTSVNATDADNTSMYPFIGNNNVKMSTSGSDDYSAIRDDSIEYTIDDTQSFVIAFFITSGNEYNYTDYISVKCGTTSPTNTGYAWTIPQADIVPDCWNVVVCAKDTHDSVGTDTVDWGDTFTTWRVDLQQNSTASSPSPDFFISGPCIAPSTLDGFQPGVYSFYYTWLYDAENKQESLPFKFSDVDDGDATPDVNKVVIHKNPCSLNFDAYIVPEIAAGYQLNKRISGSRLYWKVEENENYFLVGELDFIDNGFKWVPEGDSMDIALANASHTGTFLTYTTIAKGISPDSANTIDTFKNINGFSSETKSLDAQFKTAVVHGRRTYVGNIKQDGKTHPDRILKSQINRFDTFPQGMGIVDVAIRDGENIVKLEAFADRILEFKENSLYVINISDNIEFLEDTYRNKGCAYDYHVVKTDQGIAWFNIHGVYLYDGKQLHNLLEKGGIRVINESDWQIFITDHSNLASTADDPDMGSAQIGYIPKKRQILIKNENNDVYLYDFVLRAWTSGLSRVSETSHMTNFALSADQDLFYIDDVDADINTWQTSPQASTGFLYETPDIDFGEPGVRKKIHKVYVTYKSGATTNVQVDYDVNGGTTFPYDFADGTNFASTELASASGWQVAELKPDVSSEANNIKSFQLRFQVQSGQTVPSGFEINDITIVYRMKHIK